MLGKILVKIGDDCFIISIIILIVAIVDFFFVPIGFHETFIFYLPYQGHVLLFSHAPKITIILRRVPFIRL